MTIEEKNAIDAAIAASEERIMLRVEEKLRALELRMKEFTIEAIEASEYKLRTEFFRLAGPMETRIKSHSAAILALDLELINQFGLTRKIQ